MYTNIMPLPASQQQQSIEERNVERKERNMQKK